MTIEDRIREVVDGYVARMRLDLDAHAQTLISDLTRVVTAHQDEGRAERTTSAVERSRESRVDTLERLMGAVRSIDESSSLTGVLGALIRGAAAETSRVAILLVDGSMFRTWEHLGFEEGTAPAEMPIGAVGTLAAAVANKQTSFVPPFTEGRDSATPGFMRVQAGHTGLVVPLLVGGDAVAVLYADDASRAVAQEDVPLWTEEVQLLARHAALRLENVTSVRTVEVLAGTD